MVLFKNKILKQDDVKIISKYAWFPTWIRTEVESTSHYPTFKVTELIWLEKYIATYTYCEEHHTWVLRKTERFSQGVLNKFAELK